MTMEPIAKRLKQSAEAALSAVPKKTTDDIEDRIKQLEADLQGSGSDSSSDEEDEDEDTSASSDSEEDVDDAAKPGAVLSLSAYADERVEGLPEHLLPKASATAANLSDKKRKRTEKEATKDSLLDVLSWPKKVPFACKPCGFVGKNLKDFQAHQQSDEHLSKQQNVGQVLMCKLCDKTFTSPLQLEDHKAGKWHQQRAQQRKARHVVKVCYDFMRGQCKFGDRCNFEHTETKAMKSGKALEKTKKRVCEIFQRRGKCKYGEQCLFSHCSS